MSKREKNLHSSPRASKSGKARKLAEQKSAKSGNNFTRNVKAATTVIGAAAGAYYMYREGTSPKVVAFAALTGLGVGHVAAQYIAENKEQEPGDQLKEHAKAESDPVVTVEMLKQRYPFICDEISRIKQDFDTSFQGSTFGKK